MLIELYRVEQTQVSYWITNITGKIDCVSFYLPFSACLLSIPGSIIIRPSLLFPRDIQIDLISIYFIFYFYFFFFFFFFGNRSATQNWPFSFLISNNLRFAKRWQICLHYVLKFKRPLEIYEAFTHKKRKKNGDFITTVRLCVAHVAWSWCTQYIILSEKKKKKKKKKIAVEITTETNFCVFFFIFIVFYLYPKNFSFLNIHVQKWCRRMSIILFLSL